MKRLPGKKPKPVLLAAPGPRRAPSAPCSTPTPSPAIRARRGLDGGMKSAPGGKLVALGLSSVGGSENSVLRVLDVSSQASVLSEAIDPRKLARQPTAWAGCPMPRASITTATPRASASNNKSAVYLHKLAGRCEGHRAVRLGGQPWLKLAIEDLPYQHTASSSHFVMAQMLHGDARWTARSGSRHNGIQGAATSWRRIVTRRDRVIRAALVGDVVYAISQRPPRAANCCAWTCATPSPVQDRAAGRRQRAADAHRGRRRGLRQEGARRGRQQACAWAPRTARSAACPAF